jgi:hypothetical protein
MLMWAFIVSILLMFIFSISELRRWGLEQFGSLLITVKSFLGTVAVLSEGPSAKQPWQPFWQPGSFEHAVMSWGSCMGITASPQKHCPSRKSSKQLALDSFAITCLSELLITLQPFLPITEWEHFFWWPRRRPVIGPNTVLHLNEGLLWLVQTPLPHPFLAI